MYMAIINLIKKNIFITIFIIIGCFILIHTFFNEIKIYFAYPLGIWQSLPSIGNNCECSSGILYDSKDDFKEIKNRIHYYKKCLLPLRKETNKPIIPQNGYLIARCTLDIQNFNLEKFGWIHLGKIFGYSAIFLNDHLITIQNDNGIIEFPIHKSLISINQPNTLTIISKNPKKTHQYLGPITLMPLMLTDKRSDVKKYNRLTNFWEMEFPILVIFYCAGYFIIFSTLWFSGLKYKDLGWMLIIITTMIITYFIRYYPYQNPNIVVPHIYYKVYATLKEVCFICIIPFIYNFLRLNINLLNRIKNIAIILLIIYFILPFILTFKISSFLKINEQFASYICTILYLILSILGFLHLKTLQNKNIKRFIYCLIATIFSILSAGLLILQGLFISKYDFEPMPIIILLFITLFSITLAIDLVLYRKTL